MIRQLVTLCDLYFPVINKLRSRSFWHVTDYQKGHESHYTNEGKRDEKSMGADPSIDFIYFIILILSCLYTYVGNHPPHPTPSTHPTPPLVHFWAQRSLFSWAASLCLPFGRQKSMELIRVSISFTL